MKNFLALVVLLFQWSLLANPVIEAVYPDGRMVWRNDEAGGYVEIQRASSPEGPWVGGFFDLGATVGTRTINIPRNEDAVVLYRLRVQREPEDPSLLLHVGFENDLTSGSAVDTSALGGDGFRFGYECCPTNWPRTRVGVDGGRAAEFRWYADPRLLANKSGDYIGITNISHLSGLTNATIMVWGWYYRAYNGQASSDQASVLINAGYETTGSWQIGRSYTPDTHFEVGGNFGKDIRFPDSTFSTAGDTGGWHHYVITFAGGQVVAYFDGRQCDEGIVTVGSLVPGHYAGVAPWISLGCATHNGTPGFDDEGKDGSNANDYPNHGWLNGAIDDVLIYNRVMGPDEIRQRYLSYDKFAPSVPAGIALRSSSIGSVEVRWSPSADNFAVDRYRVMRNGMVVGETVGTLFVDFVEAMEQDLSYQLQAIDASGNQSDWSSSVSHRLAGSGIQPEAIVDEVDGAPWVVRTGTWSVRTNSAAYNGRFIQDDNSDKGAKSISFSPQAPVDGIYDIEMWYPPRGNADTKIPVTVDVDGTPEKIAVDQTTNGQRWNRIGTRTLSRGQTCRVLIENFGTKNYVQADAVRLKMRN